MMFILDQISQLAWLHPWLLTHWWTAIGDLLRDPIATDDIQRGLITAAVYAGTFWLLAWARFSEQGHHQLRLTWSVGVTVDALAESRLRPTDTPTDGESSASHASRSSPSSGAARMRPTQRRAWEQHRGAFVLEVPRLEHLDVGASRARGSTCEAFGRDAPLIVEIGPGTGESLVPMARARPERNVLAFEVYQPAIARILGAPGPRARSTTSGWSRPTRSPG